MKMCLKCKHYQPQWNNKNQTFNLFKNLWFLEKKTAAHSSIFAWEIHSPWGSQKSWTQLRDWAQHRKNEKLKSMLNTLHSVVNFCELHLKNKIYFLLWQNLEIFWHKVISISYRLFFSLEILCIIYAST